MTSYLNNMQERHHAVARLMASGRGNAEIAHILGYASGTISKLRSDPALAGIVAMYRKQSQTKVDEILATLSNTGARVLEVLIERLNNDPDAFKHQDLMTDDAR